MKYNDRGKFYHRCVSVEAKCENQMKRIFFISFSAFYRSEDMPRGSSFIIAQSLKTLQQNGPKLVYTKKIQTTINTCLCVKKKNPAVTKTTPPPEDINSYEIL